MEYLCWIFNINWMIPTRLYCTNMKSQSKKLRQSTLFESFASSKRQKIQQETSMNGNTHIRDILAAAAEGRKASSYQTSNNVFKISECQIREGSQQKREVSFSAQATCSSSVVSENYQISDSDEIYLPSSEDLFPENLQLEEKLNFGTENSVEQNSGDLFPDMEQCSLSWGQSVVENDSAEELLQLSFLNRSENCSIPLPKLEPLENHFIMFSPHIRPGVAPRPYPSSYRDKWDSDHVRMPCSPHNRYPVRDATGEKHIGSRWDLICQSLNSDIGSSFELEEAIMQYNSQYIGKWNFLGLHAFFNMHFKEEERVYFFERVLPPMIKMALDLPNICTQPIPLLKKEKDHYVTISQKQIGCLLLNAFFCTFPQRTVPNRRSKYKWNSEYSTFPDINFNRLFYGTKRGISSRNAEKLKCLFNYFRRITSKEPPGTMTFHRQYLQELPKWHESTKGLRLAIIKSDDLIETGGHGMLQVDFANKFVGGGVLGQGCVQEEIRFITCPELIVSRLFVERLGHTEALIITGVEQYNKYSGYSDLFKWEGNFEDLTPRDLWGRRCTQLVAMDAMHFKNTADQFTPVCIERELNKAFCGFYEDGFPTNLSAIATGNWGCGAFKGNTHLKFLIQLMAASQAGRSILYFTFGNKDLKRDLKKIYNFLADKNISVGDLWRILMNYCENVKIKNNEIYPNLYDFIFSVLLNKEEICTEQVAKEEKQVIPDSEKEAIQKLIEEVANESSSTDIEDNNPSPS